MHFKVPLRRNCYILFRRPIYGFKYVFNRGELNLFTSFAEKCSFWTRNRLFGAKQCPSSKNWGGWGGGRGVDRVLAMGFRSVKAQRNKFALSR